MIWTQRNAHVDFGRDARFGRRLDLRAPEEVFTSDDQVLGRPAACRERCDFVR